jgi:hypothetical protein
LKEVVFAGEMSSKNKKSTSSLSSGKNRSKKGGRLSGASSMRSKNVQIGEINPF